METLLKADIFFLITSIFVILMTIVSVIVGIYFIKIIRNFYKISKILRQSTENIDSDLRELGNEIRESPLFTFIFGKRKSKETKNTSKKSI